MYMLLAYMLLADNVDKRIGQKIISDQAKYA